ncbi:MAG: N-acetylmuramidase domain-containing protein [Pseudomonadota bacterium]
MDFKGAARRLTPEDYQKAADLIGCDLPALRAVVSVEARGKGFGVDGRPIILFEPHILYRHLGPGAKRNRAVKYGIAARKWGAIPYPRTQAARYRQLSAVISIDETAGLKSASWGLGQVIGFNHHAAGFPTVQDFARAMTASEGDQLLAMARFIVTNKLDAAIRAHDWARFARGYNGAGYRKNRYDTKLAAAYRRHSRQASSAPATKVKHSSVIKDIQMRLKALGFDPGPADGIVGRRTWAAVRACCDLYGQPVPSVLTQSFADTLDSLSKKPAVQTKTLLDALAALLNRVFSSHSKPPQTLMKGGVAMPIKPWFLSKGIIGSAITVLASLGGLVGINVEPDVTQQLAEQIVLMITAGGGILSLIGRIFATRRISL